MSSVIIGLGISGLSCARFLAKQNIPFMIMDTRPHPPHVEEFKKIFPDVPMFLGGLSQTILQQATMLIVSPGIALNTPFITEQIKRGIPVIGDVELFAKISRTPVIAITGTNGKSTVTTLVGEMAVHIEKSVQVGGNLGIPVLDLYRENPTAQLFVLELSSFQLETTFSLQPRVSSILNISPDHMDRYATVLDYQQAKQRIYQRCDFSVCNRDDQLTDNNGIQDNQKYYFTLNPPKAREFGVIIHKQEKFLAYEDQLLLSVHDLPMMGKHHYANALAALAIGYAYGWPLQPMLKVLQEFKGLPHRCQLIREHQGVKWYNDSKGTNVGASIAAIESLGNEISGKLIVIAGGVGKQADFQPFVHFAEKYLRHMILIGEAANEIARCIAKRFPFSFADTLDEAVKQAKEIAITHDAVLLSPACASFDMFQNYEHRGNVFMDIVNKI